MRTDREWFAPKNDPAFSAPLLRSRRLRSRDWQPCAQISKLPTEIRDQLTSAGKIEGRLRRLEQIAAPQNVAPSGAYRLGWLQSFIEDDRAARREIRRLERRIDALLDQHGTTLRDEPDVGPIAAATLVCEVGDPHRFATESKFARWCGTGAVALSSGEAAGLPAKHRVDFRGNRTINSVLYIASVTQARDIPKPAPTSTANEQKVKPAEKPDDPTNDTSPTASSDACGKTKTTASTINHPARFDKEA